MFRKVRWYSNIDKYRGTLFVKRGAELPVRISLVILHCLRLVVMAMWMLCDILLVNGGAVQPVKTRIVILHCMLLVVRVMWIL